MRVGGPVLQVDLGASNCASSARLLRPGLLQLLISAPSDRAQSMCCVFQQVFGRQKWWLCH